MKIRDYFFLILFFVLKISFSGSLNAQLHGMIKIDNEIYLQETEVDVGSWLSFYSWVIENKGHYEAMKLLPDSSVIDLAIWNYIRTQSEVYNEKIANTGKSIGFFKKDCDISDYKGRAKNLRGNCALLYLPITGITYEQASAFCEWRTEIYNDEQIEFRLPSAEEWIEFAIKNLSENERLNRLRDSVDKNNCPSYNYNFICNCISDSVQGKINSVAMFRRERIGSFDFFGNVSEMTHEKGIAKGGNYLLHASKSHIDSSQLYTKPEAWLGFRCIAVKKNSAQKEKRNQKINDIGEYLNAGIELIDERDGRKYRIVTIVGQVWLAQNLVYKPESGKYWIPENNPKNINRYGYLYNWETAQNVCPSGWRLPSMEDFNYLIEFIGEDESAKKLVASGDSGFSALFGGFHSGMNYLPSGYGTSFWTSSSHDEKRIWVLSIGSENSNAQMNELRKNKNLGYPVRCIKNNE